MGRKHKEVEAEDDRFIKPHISGLSVILVGVGALFWTYGIYQDVINQTYLYSKKMFVLDIVCFVALYVIFFMRFRKYRKEKKQDVLNKIQDEEDRKKRSVVDEHNPQA